MTTPQSVLPPIPNHARYLELHQIHDCDPLPTIKALAELDINDLVVGFGPGLTQGLGVKIDGLHAFRPHTGPACEVPTTQADLWLWIKGDDRGEIATTARKLIALLAPAFQVVRATNGFKYASGLDLSGYEDGTENPKGEDATQAALVQSGPLSGSSFVSVQKWQHDLDYFDSLPQSECDDVIGRRRADNVEFDGSPASAHTKRTAQESFTPEAFLLRRSMPWSDTTGEGLVFVAFGNSFDAFEAQLTRMTGGEDGIIDGLFRFSRPISGANYWCPPLKGGKLDLSVIGL